MGGVEEAEQVDLDHPLPFLDRGVDDRAEQHHAGVVDERRRAGPAPRRLRPTARLGLLAVGDVGLDRQRRAAGVGDLRGQRLSRSAAAGDQGDRRRPAPARPRAVASPMPLEAPVTSATVPSSLSVELPRRHPTRPGAATPGRLGEVVGADQVGVEGGDEGVGHRRHVGVLERAQLVGQLVGAEVELLVEGVDLALAVDALASTRTPGSAARPASGRGRRPAPSRSAGPCPSRSSGQRCSIARRLVSVGARSLACPCYRTRREARLDPLFQELPNAHYGMLPRADPAGVPPRYHVRRCQETSDPSRSPSS